MEVEAKFRLLCKPELIVKKLLERGFVETGLFVETDFYFKHPCRDLKLTDEALRVRYRKSLNNGSSICLLCYKGPRISHGLIKAREELEVAVGGFSETLFILRKLGFEDFASFTKIRREFVYRDLKVCLDELLNVGFFVEFEGASLNEIEGLFNELNICLEPVSKTYLEICIEKGGCVVKLE